MKQWLGEWMSEPVNERASSRLSYPFPKLRLFQATVLTELLLHWAISSLSHSFSEAPLFSSTSSLSCLFFFSAQLCQCASSPPITIPHSRSAPPNRPTCSQRWQWGWFRATLNASVLLRLFTTCTFFRPRLPKVAQPCGEKRIFNQNRGLATASCTFCRLLFQIEAENTQKQTLLPWGHRACKNTAIHAHPLFHQQFHKLPDCFCSLLIPPANCCCYLCGWHHHHHEEDEEEEENWPWTEICPQLRSLAN